MLMRPHSMYLHDPLMDVPCPAMEDPPADFLRTGAENPQVDQSRPSAVGVFYYSKENFLRLGAENPLVDLPCPSAVGVFFSI